MRVRDMAAKSKKFLDFDLPISGLYLLAAPSTPELAREVILDRAEEGEKITLADVEAAVKQAREEAMRVHELGKSVNLTDLDIPVSGLYLLAAPSTPEPVRARARRRWGRSEVPPQPLSKDQAIADAGLSQRTRTKISPARRTYLERGDGAPPPRIHSEKKSYR
jgi:hypothetical protein